MASGYAPHGYGGRIAGVSEGATARHAARMTARAQWTPPQGIIEFPGGIGTCRITTGPSHLDLAIEAAGHAALTQLQEIIGRDIERFASRDGLTVDWVQPEIS